VQCQENIQRGSHQGSNREVIGCGTSSRHVKWWSESEDVRQQRLL